MSADPANTQPLGALFTFAPSQARARQTRIGSASSSGLGSVEYIRDLGGLDRAFTDAERLLSLPDNWDGEGASAYRAETVNRAKSFLYFLAARAYPNSLALPAVLPADKGSIDLYWKTEKRMLLVNFPADPAEPGTYFGHYDEKNTCSGVVEGNRDRPDILAWVQS